MSHTLTVLHDKAVAFEEKLRTEVPAEFHHLADEFRKLFSELAGEGEADAAAVVEQAAPVAEAAKGDVEQLAKDAEAGAAAIVDPSAAPSA